MRMKRLVVGALVATVMGGVPLSAHAQQTVQVDGVEATRIVIAPPQTPLARIIKSDLKANYENARRGTRAYDDAQKLYFFYGARNFEPLWLTNSADGSVDFSAKAKQIMDVFAQAELTGLNPDDYLTPALDLSGIDSTPGAAARLETAFSAAAIRYAQDTHSGRLNPRKVSGYITLQPERLDDAQTLMDLVNAPDPETYYAALEPQEPEFKQLKAALDKRYQGETERPVRIPAGGILRPGNVDERVPLLRERLGLKTVTDERQKDVYDLITVAAVKEFQSGLDLVVDGIVGPATIAALNGGGAISKEDIIANMEMWRWEPHDLGNFRVMVNVPEFRLRVLDNGKTVYTTRVVTGKKSNQTPIFSDQMEYIVVNPYWNVPQSIASEEIAPILAKNPGYIARNNMEVLSGGKVVDAAAIDWSTANVRNFRIRQRPGSNNALGSIKFLFPNQHDVYLHDTPSKYLFKRSYRAYSHGCVRVQNPWDFAAALMTQKQTKVSAAGLSSQRGGSERWNTLNRKIPVHITYFTLRAGEDGKLRSYGDIYGHADKVKRLLGLND